MIASIILSNTSFWFFLSSSASEVRTEVRSKGLAYRPSTLDMGTSSDPCAHTRGCLLSERDLETMDRAKPVVLLVHGFSASTYEWQDFARYLDQFHRNKIEYSLVLLGGHGRSLEVFANSSWRDWGAPILREYQQLRALGFNHIHIAASSMGCALLLQALAEGFFSEPNGLGQIFLIDPLVRPFGFLQGAVTWLASWTSLSYGITQAFTPEEFSYWHATRPFSALHSANDLAHRLQLALFRRLKLPPGVSMTVWASQEDPTVDPSGYLDIKNGIIPSEEGHATFYPVDSKLHVFTRLSGRPKYQPEDDLDTRTVLERVADTPISVTEDDRKNQKEVFDKIIDAIITNR